jgi:hypothetical protein
MTITHAISGLMMIQQSVREEDLRGLGGVNVGQSFLVPALNVLNQFPRDFFSGI